MGSANVVLYAQWTTSPTYTVTYNGNGSSGGTAPVDPNNYANGATVTVLSQATLVRTGYTFNGWNTKADGTGTASAGGATFSITSANITLYAQWKAIAAYTVTYNANGSTNGSVPTDTGHYTTGSSVTTKTNSGNLVKTGNQFSG